ncbi:30S ribosomal protein S3ae [Candidatus Hecatella orcuttiae]|uniref:30S ribosomal protein S3ae n=1 Tax=Candidatus Hecatella orcuttiae TaxID=1935119 RepID=UPI00286838E7|nr:30S ribosomal protein S3ae [Candidatus Hecatella orcuttiae]
MSSQKRGKIRDKWRLKTWFTAYAPPYFGGHEIALLPASDSQHLMGRVVETTLYDLTKQNVSHMSIKIFFQVVKVEGAKAETVFKGHEYAREYLRSLVRRWSSKVDAVVDTTTKDGFKLRILATAFTKRRANPSQETAIRTIAQEVIQEKSKTLNFDQLVQELVLGKVASEIYNKSTKILPLRHVGVRKSKLLAMPSTYEEPKLVAA